MFLQSADITEELQDMAALAAAELFGAYGVHVGRSGAPWQETEEVLYSGVMGFIGDRIRGTCLLAAPAATILASAPEPTMARDWTGELANQLVGRLKSKLLARGIVIAMTTPVVLSGVKLQPLPRSSVAPSVFETSSGRALVWLEVEVEPDFKLGSMHPLNVTEGGFLAF